MVSGALANYSRCQCHRGSGLPMVGDGGTSPRRRSPLGTPPGALAPTLRVWGHAGWKVFRKLVSGDSRRSADYPENARSILSLGKPLGPGWALGGHPETSALPHSEWMRFGEACPFRVGDGLVGAKTQSPRATGAGGGGEAFPGKYSDWRPRALRHAVGARYSGGGLAGIRNR